MNVREWALPVYTILMQLAVGAFAILWLIRYLAGSKFSAQEIDHIISNPILVIAITAVVAMGGAHFHLSKPFHSFLAVLNFKSSWLSREIVFSVLFFIATISVLYLTYFQTHRRRLISILGWMAIIFGFILIYCMARIYLIPTQVAWNSTTVIFSFYTTALMLGGMAISTLMVLDLKFAEIQKADDVDLLAQVIRYSYGGLTALTVVLVALSLTIIYVQIHLLTQGDLIARTSLSLLIDIYLPLFLLRLIFLIYASTSLIYAVIRMYRLKSPPQNLMMPVYLSCLLILVGEIIGRFLFYATHIRVGL
ncbi:MAG: dimethyl sulfoxide reductase anchor subunit [Anaerolineae bacterium]|jgi:anaerobic dimethyl sulfoxide reductase subunit C (anchor subunit)|nr:dimethyl sulfoxide reductase anchor subunit [Anaerolineae bacterium]